MKIVYSAYYDVDRGVGNKVGKVNICGVYIDVSAKVGFSNGEGV